MNEQPDTRAPQSAHPPIVGVIGRSGSGKTTLIEALIPALAELGVRVATIKRTPRFDIDKPGKDSWRHGQAGATAYVVASASQLAFVEATPAPAEPEARRTTSDEAEGAAPPKPPRDEAGRPAPRGPSLTDIAARFFANDIDLVLHEGHRREAPQVIEVFRLAAGHDRPALRARRVARSGHRRAPRPRAPLRPRRRRRARPLSGGPARAFASPGSCSPRRRAQRPSGQPGTVFFNQACG